MVSFTDGMSMENRVLALGELRQIAQKMRASGLSSIELSGSNYRVRLKYSALPPATSHPLPEVSSPCLPEQSSSVLTAPMPGILLFQHPQSSTPFVRPGERVKKNMLIGLLKVGVAFLPLRSPADGIVELAGVKQGDKVEYGTEIFILSAAEAAA